MLAHVTTAAPPHVALEEIADAVPAAHEALVEVHAVSLFRGQTRRLARPPHGSVPGSDLAGVVVRAAANGSGPAAGERVVGWVEGGAWAQLAAVPADQLAPLPDSVAAVDAAALPTAGLTALRALELAGNVLAKRVLVTGASGGVGRYGVQAAKLAGAHVTAVSSGGPRAHGLAEIGADEIVPAVPADGAPFDLILDGVGGATLGAAIQRVASFGTVIAYSVSDSQPICFPANGLVGRASSARVQALRLSDELRREGSCGRDLRRLVHLLATGRLDAQVALTGSWRTPGPVIDALLERRVAGKAVLELD